jgi:two-component system, LuxR family, response regulator FixJ
MTENTTIPASGEPTVFVIDDDPAVRQSLCWLVESVDWCVKAFGSAQPFLDSYSPDQPGCVITDVRMPGVGGLQLQQQMVERGNAIPLIMMTGYGDVQTAVRAMKAGAIDFLEKPYNDQALLDLVAQAIARDREAREVRKEADAARKKFSMLTRREAETMRLIVQGMANKQMSGQLEISIKTVEAHRSRVMEKMGTHSVARLTQLAAFCF